MHSLFLSFVILSWNHGLVDVLKKTTTTKKNKKNKQTENKIMTVHRMRLRLAWQIVRRKYCKMVNDALQQSNLAEVIDLASATLVCKYVALKRYVWAYTGSKDCLNVSLKAAIDCHISTRAWQHPDREYGKAGSGHHWSCYPGTLPYCQVTASIGFTGCAVLLLTTFNANVAMTS